jgi:hypothetical protein
VIISAALFTDVSICASFFQLELRADKISWLASLGIFLGINGLYDG